MSNEVPAPQTDGTEHLLRILHAAADGFWRTAEREGPRSPNHLIGFTVQLLAHRFDLGGMPADQALARAALAGLGDDPMVLLEAATDLACGLPGAGELPGDLVGELDTLIREARGCAAA